MPRKPSAEFPTPVLITATAPLAELCARLRHEPFVTIDTEFMRERTYFPELCVVQLAGRDDVAVIDALAPDLDLAPLAELLADPAVIKVFHAARQDVEIFLHRFGQVPTPIFDTQIAAMVAGFGDQVGYDSLVAALVGTQIDKAHRFSDWSARPLSPAQLAYAAADVTWLRPAYERLCAKLEKEGRLDWVKEELAVLADPATYRADPETLWERLRPRTNNRRLLATLRAAVAWREREAQRINIPRQRLIKDESLLEIAATLPRTPEALGRIRGVTKGFAEGKTAAGLLAIVDDVANTPDADLSALPAGRNGAKSSPALVSLLRVLMAAKCEQHNVAPRLLATSDDLERLAAEDEPDIPVLAGWRREVFGEDALALKAGRITLGVDGRRVKLVRS